MPINVRRWLILLALGVVPKRSRLAQGWRCKYDLHDYCDWDHGEPWHFYEGPCVRCGKQFYI